MGESDTKPADVMTDTFRNIFTSLDGAAFWLLSIMYQIFFNVASADLFSNDTIMKFYGRIQLVLGVFMIFQLALTILKGIVNPDNFFKGDKGGGGIITRVAIALILLTVLVPISTPGSNEFEKQVNNNGLLFGTLYSLQHRLLSNNTVGRLILGTNEADYVSSSSEDSEDSLEVAANSFTSTIMKAFYRINLIPKEERKQHEAGKDDAVFNDNRVCKDWDDELLAAYLDPNATPDTIKSMALLTCEGEDVGLIQGLVGAVNPRLSGTEYYYLAYIAIIPFIVAIVFCFILLSFTVDIAVRAIKIAVLRLIAPIPIISYIDPNGSKDSSLNSWVKALVSTYIDLFIRLAAIYFVIFLIQNMLNKGFVMNKYDGPIGIISTILIWIGLFVFAKQAPKFIKDILGMKGESGKLFGGWGDLVGVVSGAAAGGTAVAGAIGSGATNFRAARAEGKELYGGEDGTDKKILRALRTGASTVAGVGGGLYTGVKAATAKDASPKTVIAAQQQRNASRASHSTAQGRLLEDLQSQFTGQSRAINANKTLEATDKSVKLIGELKTETDKEGLKSGSGAVIKADWLSGAFNPNMVGKKFNYQQLYDAYSRADSDGAFVAYDTEGNAWNANRSDFKSTFFDQLKNEQIRNWVSGAADSTASGGKTYEEFMGSDGKGGSIQRDLDAELAKAHESVRETFRSGDLSTYGTAQNAGKDYVRDAKAGKGKAGMKLAIRNANNKKGN